MRKFILTVFTSFALGSLVMGADKTPSALDQQIQQANDAYRSGRFGEALTIVSAEVKKAPNNLDIRMFRAQLLGALAKRAGTTEVALKFNAGAAADYSEVIRLQPRSEVAYQERGSAHFRQAMIEESIKDWDKYIELKPESEPYHWQRGIAHYYAGRFADGRKQFEMHQTVNSADVENAVFHYICTARSLGIERAKKDLIPIAGDRRIPMMEIHGLYAGKNTVEEILKQANTGTPDAVEHQAFYAHYYIGLYFESHGQNAKGREHIMKAAQLAANAGYMGDCAKVHAMLLKRTEKKKAASAKK
jgi:lipoprotein NlpI